MNDAPPTHFDSNLPVVREAILDGAPRPRADVQFFSGEGARAILRELSGGGRSVRAAGFAPIGEPLSIADRTAVGR